KAPTSSKWSLCWAIARATSWRAWAVVSAGLFFEREAQTHQEEMGLKRLQHVMMPPQPTTGLILVLPHFPLAFLQCGLNRPAPARDAHQFGMRAVGRRVAQVALDLGRVGQAAAKGRPQAWPWQAVADRRHAPEGEVGFQWAAAAFLNRPTLPGR